MMELVDDQSTFGLETFTTDSILVGQQVREKHTKNENSAASHLKNGHNMANMGCPSC